MYDVQTTTCIITCGKDTLQKYGDIPHRYFMEIFGLFFCCYCCFHWDRTQVINTKNNNSSWMWFDSTNTSYHTHICDGFCGLCLHHVCNVIDVMNCWTEDYCMRLRSDYMCAARVCFFPWYVLSLHRMQKCIQLLLYFSLNAVPGDHDT